MEVPSATIDDVVLEVNQLRDQVDQLRTLKRTLLKMKILTTQLKYDIAKAEIHNSAQNEGAKKWKNVLNNLLKGIDE